MSLNSSPINTAAVNAVSDALGSSIFAGGVVVSIGQRVGILANAQTAASISQVVLSLFEGPAVNIAQAVKSIIPAQIAVDIAQNVGYLKAAAVISNIAQEVLFEYLAPSQVVASIAQEVKAVASPIISIAQSVILEDTPNTFYSKHGFEPMLYVGASQIPLNQIHDIIECTYTQEDAPQLNFSLITPTGLQDVRSYRGKSVLYKIRTVAGVQEMFSGKVNAPLVNLLEQTLDFNCTIDIEQNVENLMTRSQLNQIGYYNNAVFPIPSTQLQELKDRVSTIPSVINMRKSGSPAVDPIAVASVADYTLTDNEVLRRNISFQLSSGQRYINKINLNVVYSYQRLHHHQRRFAVRSGLTSACDILTTRATIPTRELVASAVTGSGWHLNGGIAYDPVPASGWYRCGGRWIGWSTISSNVQTTTSVDADGNAITKDGEDVLEKRLVSQTDASGALCLGAGWSASTRFSQNIKSTYTLTINAPQSQAENGVKVKELNFNLASDYDSAAWEDYKSHSTNTPLSITGSDTSSNFWIDADTNKTLFDQSVNIMLNKAKSDILKSHRDDRVIFSRGLWTDVDLQHTIKLNCTKLVVSGRVYKYTHSIDCSSGEGVTSVELALSQSTGSVTDTTLSLPSTATNTPVYQTTLITQGNSHYGQDPSVATSNGWTGFIGNQATSTSVKTDYTQALIVDTPDIEPGLRNELSISKAASYDVSIPNDNLTITFDQWT